MALFIRLSRSIILSLTIGSATSFGYRHPGIQTKRLSKIYLAKSTIPDALPNDPFFGSQLPPKDELPQGISRFLTQRAIQTQLYYYDLNLDETSGKWLAEFRRADESSSPLHADYHGINALPTPDSATFLCALLAYPEVEVTVRKPMGCAAGRGHGGINGATGLPITRNANPYLQQRYFEYKDLIRPSDMGVKLLTIRAQVAAELVHDIQFLRAENEALRVIFTRDSRQQGDGSMGAKFEMPGGFCPNEQSDTGGRSSPFRIANFDLAKLLATKEALVKVADGKGQNGPLASAARAALLEWLPAMNSHSAWTHGQPDAVALADKIMLDIVARNKNVKKPELALGLVEARDRVVDSWQRDLEGSLQLEQTMWQRWYLSRSVSFSTVGDGADVDSASGKEGISEDAD